MLLVKLVTKVLLIALALVLAAYLIPGISVSGLYIAIVAALLLGLVNITIRPILFLLTLPVTIVTLGLFALVLNALLFWFIASFVEGFEVSGFLPAFLGALVVSIVSAIGNRFVKD